MFFFFPHNLFLEVDTIAGEGNAVLTYLRVVRRFKKLTVPLTLYALGRFCFYRGADKSLAQPGWTQARKHARNSRDFNSIETRAVIKFFFLQGKAPKEIHATRTETLACFLPGVAKDLSAPLYAVDFSLNFLCLFSQSICSV